MDREKVLTGLECHLTDNNHRINCVDCPYYVDDDNYIKCVNYLRGDAFTLFKEQEDEIWQLKLALDIAKGTCKGIKIQS